jgi:hypothetical protein
MKKIALSCRHCEGVLCCTCASYQRGKSTTDSSDVEAARESTRAKGTGGPTFVFIFNAIQRTSRMIHLTVRFVVLAHVEYAPSVPHLVSQRIAHSPLQNNSPLLRRTQAVLRLTRQAMRRFGPHSEYRLKS